MNIFELAILQVQREGNWRRKDRWGLVIDRAITIRRYLDLQERNRKVWESRKKRRKNGKKY